jgi:hypothetical protein
VIFMHIPRTGGTTLTGVFYRQYSKEHVFYIHDKTGAASAEGLSVLPEEEKREIRAVLGHHLFGLHQLLPQPTVYFTFMRDPVKHVISQYFFHLAVSSPRVYRESSREAVSLREYVELPHIGTSNGQVWMFTAGGETPRGEECNRERLETAKQVIRELFPVVGLLEHYDESLLMARRALGWKIPFYHRENTNLNSQFMEKVDDDIIEIIRQRNQFGIELYAYVQELYAQAIQRQPASFATELRLFRLGNRIFNHVIYRLWKRGKRSARYRLGQLLARK